MVGLMALCVPVQAATVNAVVPDIQMGVGETSTFDVSDMVIGTPDVSGGALTDGSLEVFGSDSVGMLDLIVGDDSSVVSVGPVVSGPGLVMIPLMSGDTAEGSVDLPDLGGGGGTPGGGTPSAALIATVGSVMLDVGGNGLRSRVSSVGGDGVVPTLNADGSYSIAENGLAGDAVVTLGAGGSAVHLNVASSVAVDMGAAAVAALPAGDLAQADPTYDGGITIDVGPGQGTLVVALAGVSVGDPGSEVTLQADYSATAVDNVNVAIIAFDAADVGGLNPSAIAYSNAGAPQIQAGEGTLSVSFTSASGMVVPAIQVACGADSGGGAVTLSNIQVVSAGPLTSYALNPNAKADLLNIVDQSAIDGSAASVDGWLADILATGEAGGPAASGENNFESAAGAGAMSLAGADGVANAAAQVSVGAGAVALECYAMAAGGDGNLALVLTGGGGADVEIFALASSLSSDGFGKLTVGTTLAADATAFLVVQAAGADVVVDDICVRVDEDIPAFLDYALLGM
jgi:hypothetical protein